MIDEQVFSWAAALGFSLVHSLQNVHIVHTSNLIPLHPFPKHHFLDIDKRIIISCILIEGIKQ